MVFWVIAPCRIMSLFWCFRWNAASIFRELHSNTIYIYCTIMASVPHATLTQNAACWAWTGNSHLECCIGNGDSHIQLYHLCGGGHQTLPTASLLPSSCPLMVWFDYVPLDEMLKYNVLSFQWVSHHTVPIMSFFTPQCVVQYIAHT